MAENETTTQERGKANAVNMAQFTVEFGDDCGRTITLNTLRLRLRGAWSISRLMSKQGGGRAIGEAMSGMPNIPGMRCKVEPRHSRVTIFDPLENEPDLLAQINKLKEKWPIIGGESNGAGKWKPNDTAVHVLVPDEFKSVVLDLVDLYKGKMLVPLDGSRIPSQEEAEALPGKQLYDPWSNSRAKPTYAEDEHAYFERILTAKHG